MKFSLIVCTYNRPQALLRLLHSVDRQEVKPDEILVVDGSTNQETSQAVMSVRLPSLRYLKVTEQDRGLTRQRNYGILEAKADAEVICFLDDDVVLEKDYFQKLLKTYEVFPDALGVGGYIIEDIEWKKKTIPRYDEFGFDGWSRKLGSRNLLRKRFGLLSNKAPGVMPEFSNGFSTGFLPPSEKVYPVEYFMGGVASYRKNLFEKISFSPYFEGYGLYEDMDFCLRASRIGQLYVNTAARLHHLHEEQGRPNRYTYGKMVIRNGWYVWRTKYPNPNLRARLMWNYTHFLLTLIRLGNSFTTSKKKEALTESIGRIAGWWSLLFSKPLKKKSD